MYGEDDGFGQRRLKLFKRKETFGKKVFRTSKVIFSENIKRVQNRIIKRIVLLSGFCIFYHYNKSAIYHFFVKSEFFFCMLHPFRFHMYNYVINIFHRFFNTVFHGLSYIMCFIKGYITIGFNIK